jgi:hypothetical protein
VLIVWGRLRILWPVLLAAIIAVAGGWALYNVWRSPHRNDLATYGAFAVGLFALAGTWIAWVWQKRAKRDATTSGSQDIDQIADLLSGAVGKQWEQAASERGLLWPEPIPVRWRAPSEAMAGPVVAAIRSTRFEPLPGLRAVKVQNAQKGNVCDLHAIYGGLGSGRLVIAGPPGSGKSGAAVLLVLAALRHRNQVPDTERRHIPVPVLFTAHGWDPVNQRVQDWLSLQLQRTYPFFSNKVGARNAAALIATGKIAVILDGLDEIPEETRPVALQALSQQAMFRIVVLTRSAEMVTAVSQQSLLEGAVAVELQDIDPTTAADYLTYTQPDPPPEGWRELINRLRQEPMSPLARALISPLMLTLVCNTYRAGDNAGELLGLRDADGHPASSGDIVDHLLDRVLPAAYAQRPGNPPPRYYVQTAQNAFQKIAERMNEDGTRDLLWSRIPSWTPGEFHILKVYLSGWPLAWLTVGIAFRFWGWAELIGTCILWLIALYVMLLGLIRGPCQIAHTRWRNASASPLSPLSSWRTDRAFGLLLGLVLGLIITLLVVGLLVISSPFATFHDYFARLPIFAAFGLVIGLLQTETSTAWLAFVLLAVRWHTPLSLMRFLEDAHQRGVLRTVGPVYQFRHARLQDRLAEQASVPVPAHDPSKAAV